MSSKDVKIMLPTPAFGQKVFLPAPCFDRVSSAPSPCQAPPVLIQSGMTRLASNRRQLPLPPPQLKAQQQPEAPQLKVNVKPQKKPTDEEPLWCKLCELEFPTQQLLSRHFRQHVGCPTVGCKYRAIKELMDTHVSVVHNGLYNKYKNLLTLDEIRAYNAERKKLFPTQARKEQKRLVEEQRKRRGELLEAREQRFATPEMRQRMAKTQQRNKILNKHANWEKRRSSSKNKFVKKTEQSKALAAAGDVEMPKITQFKHESAAVEHSCCGIPMFKGTANMPDYKHMKTPKPKNKLAGLLAMYGSDDDDDDNDDNNDNDSSDEAPEELPVIRVEHRDAPIAALRPSKLQKRRTKNLPGKAGFRTNKPVDFKRRPVLRSGLNYSLIPKSDQHSLLNSLLADQIRHERNVLLQVVRYVCEQNFFGIGQAKASTAVPPSIKLQADELKSEELEQASQTL